MDLGILGGLQDRIEWHESIGSTNDRARQLAREGAVHGFVVGADAQTAGRGRKGAEWMTSPGRGLAFSVVVRPTWQKDRWGWLSLSAGLAVCHALEEMDFAVQIKWPNDVLLECRKVCGILIETHGEAAVIGIGININEPEFPPELSAISLAQAGGAELERLAVLGEVWKRLMAVLDRDPAGLAEEVWERLAWRDKEVSITGGRTGRVRGFGENGELTVETGGELVRISDVEGLRLAGD